MSQSLTASRHFTPRSSYCQNTAREAKSEEERERETGISVNMASAHFAVPAAEAVAAHGVVGEGALLTAVCSRPCTLLQVREDHDLAESVFKLCL